MASHQLTARSPPREISLVSTAVIQVCPRNSGATCDVCDSRPLSTLARPKLSCVASINKKYAPPNPASGKLLVFRLTTPPIVGHVEGLAAVKHAMVSVSFFDLAHSGIAVDQTSHPSAWSVSALNGCALLVLPSDLHAGPVRTPVHCRHQSFPTSISCRPCRSCSRPSGGEHAGSLPHRPCHWLV